MRRPAIQRFAFRVVSQIDIEYRDGPLSLTLDNPPHDAPHAGDRFPWLELAFTPGGQLVDVFAKLDDTRFNLFVIGQPVPDTLPLADLLQVHAISPDGANAAALAGAAIAAPSFYLIRPDGHIALCGAHIDTGALERYVRERLRIDRDEAR
jgi:hypothetical protein